jgi:hypothetical protein
MSDPRHKGPQRRAECPACERSVAVTENGFLRYHRRCPGSRLHVLPRLPMPDFGSVDDGYGSVPRCAPDCQVEVVRPGKFQCDRCDRA